MAKKQRLAFLLEFRCERCHWNQKHYTSKQTETSKYKTPFEINTRAIAEMREIGKGLTSLKMLCGYLNMPPPMQIAAFSSLSIVGKAYETVVTDSMNNAAHELLINEKVSEYVTENNILDITVSGDGSWQKRGHSSLNGVVTLVASDTGKCVDYRVLSKHCASCKSWETKKICKLMHMRNLLQLITAV